MISTWLVPEYTTIPEDACTALLLSRSGTGHCAENNLDWTQKTHIYIDAVKGAISSEKITNVALVRIFISCGAGLKHAEGYNGITSGFKDILWDYNIHLLWKTVAI